MPLPPTPPRRPLRPPVLFGFDGHDIRLRSDVEAIYGSWDAFLDRVAEVGRDMLGDLGVNQNPVLFFHQVIRLVPEQERRDLSRELNRRMQALTDKRREREDEVWETKMGAYRALARHQAARKSKPSILDRLFGKAA
ncbi:hypothetical protein MKK55_18685 [Methylobacterium sp. J-059]|uniref:hypothetical protein n=1 Tax=Methylobacterium sp. J-059 TaxID=2836643 RepID=UPI001FB876A9|nr:hypothetical protein [Methylobacterium sp. J-059]MCJ2040958.1 hypothetical protein [Methylobacterium sp. J-059]